MAPDVELLVDGVRYGGWKSVRVTLSLESLAGSFALDVSDRWSDDAEPWPIQEEDPCRVTIGSGDRRQTVIDGFVDSRAIRADATTRDLTYSGKDRAGAIVESSLLVKASAVKAAKWTFFSINIADFCRQVAAPHGIAVSVQPGLVLPVDPRLVAHVGETGFEAVKRAAGSATVLIVSDGKGGILITRTGTARAAPLIEGANIKSAEVKYDATGRFRSYLVSTQSPGTDEASGEASQIQAEAKDLAVRRASRTLIIRPDKSMTTAEAKRRADWEARVRAAKATTATVTVQGWQQPSGELWPLNAIVNVHAPRMIGVDGDMLISQVEYSISEGGQITQLNLVRPDAFEPEPLITGVGGVGASQPWLVLDKQGEFVEPKAGKPAP
jgi:prophage tail gpP-like protein